MSYCDFVAQLPENSSNPNLDYHQHEYGFPVDDDHALFERLVLEMNQAGLSWTLILKKKLAFQQAYAQFDIHKVARFDDVDIARLMSDSGIIRNRLKIQATIYNAQQILILQQQYGSFSTWLSVHQPRSLGEWLRLFKKQFKFVGPEIVKEFLMSIGYLPGAHVVTCPVYEEVLKKCPPWCNYSE